MEENIKNFLKKGLNLIIIIGAFGSAFLFFSYILGYLSSTRSFISANLLQISIGILFIWLLILTILPKIKHGPVKHDSNNITKIIQKEISIKEKYFLEELGKLEYRLNVKIKDDVSDLRREVLDLKTNIPFKEKNIGDLIKILNLDIKKGWDWRIDETLERIRKHIEKEGISSHYVTDLNKALNSLSKEYNVQKGVISKLIQEKRY